MENFLSLDPILGSPGVPQSWNRYAYVMGNPANFINPLGLQTRCANPTGETDQAAFCDTINVTPDVTTTNPDVRDVGVGGDISGGPEQQYRTLRVGIRQALLRGEGSSSGFSLGVLQGVSEVAAPIQGLETLTIATTSLGMGGTIFAGLTTTTGLVNLADEVVMASRWGILAWRPVIG